MCQSAMQRWQSKLERKLQTLRGEQPSDTGSSHTQGADGDASSRVAVTRSARTEPAAAKEHQQPGVPARNPARTTSSSVGIGSSGGSDAISGSNSDGDETGSEASDSDSSSGSSSGESSDSSDEESESGSGTDDDEDASASGSESEADSESGEDESASDQDAVFGEGSGSGSGDAVGAVTGVAVLEMCAAPQAGALALHAQL